MTVLSTHFYHNRYKNIPTHSSRIHGKTCGTHHLPMPLLMGVCICTYFWSCMLIPHYFPHELSNTVIYQFNSFLIHVLGLKEDDWSWTALNMNYKNICSVTNRFSLLILCTCHKWKNVIKHMVPIIIHIAHHYVYDVCDIKSTTKIIDCSISHLFPAYIQRVFLIIFSIM